MSGRLGIRTLLASLLGSVLAMPGNAAAQDATAIQAMRQQADFVECIMKRKGYKAEELLAIPPGHPQEEVILQSLIIRECLVGDKEYEPDNGKTLQLRMPIGTMRGAVAEVLFLRDFGTAGADATRKPLEIFETVDLSDSPTVDLRRLVGLSTAICAVSQSPESSRSILETKPATNEERERMVQFLPSLKSCIMDGRNMKFSTVMLRGLISEASYRIRAAGSQGVDRAEAILPMMAPPLLAPIPQEES